MAYCRLLLCLPVGLVLFLDPDLGRTEQERRSALAEDESFACAVLYGSELEHAAGAIMRYLGLPLRKLTADELQRWVEDGALQGAPK